MGIGMTIVCHGFTATPDVERLAGVELVGLACAQDWQDCEVVIDAHAQPSGRLRFTAHLQLTGSEGASRAHRSGSHTTVADALADAFREAATPSLMPGFSDSTLYRPASGLWTLPTHKA